MITILTDKAAESPARDLYEKIAKKREDVKYFRADNMKIEPCYACRGCEEKTYGRCIVRDDADLILPNLSRSETIFVFTPIVFGGYSFKIKRAIDKFTLIVNKHYDYHRGELRKGKPSGLKYYALGFHDGGCEEEILVFRQLIMETLRIAAWTGRAFVMPGDKADYDSLIQEVFGI
jgi:multimeric flavodoxin WrbA